MRIDQRLFLAVAATLFVCAAMAGDGEPELAAPAYGEAFWSHWGDGRAELSGYELKYSRYGALRDGSAVAIFVTESFSKTARVKHENPGRDSTDVVPVIKLNLVQDFATGIYDYNLMTSTFVALGPLDGRGAGHTAKTSFSSQEWCGQAYAQLRFAEDGVRLDSHSYFDGEADATARLDYPVDGLAEDALLLWARGLAAPALAPGESRRVHLLRSLESVRLDHVEPEWSTAELTRGAETRRVAVPAGEFDVVELRVEVLPGPRAWTFWVERDAPHRIVRWSRSDGTEAQLTGSARLPYWSMNGAGMERALKQIGLSPRPARTP